MPYSAGSPEPLDSRVYRPRLIGYLSSSESMMNGSRKLFQLPTNWSMKIVTMPGSIMGSPIEVKIRNSLAPSMRADSIVASGTDASAYTRAR